jgi:hypothetical protein
MCNRIVFLNKIKENSCITYGYIIKIEEKKIRFYLPEYKLEEKIHIVPRKFESLYEFHYEYFIDNEENKIKRLICKNTEEKNEKSFSLYEKKEIKLWVFFKEDNIFDKLCLEII